MSLHHIFICIFSISFQMKQVERVQMISAALYAWNESIRKIATVWTRVFREAQVQIDEAASYF